MGKARRQGKICKQLRGYLNEKRRYWKLKAEGLDRVLLRTRFGRGYGPVVRHYVKMKEFVPEVIPLPYFV